MSSAAPLAGTGDTAGSKETAATTAASNAANDETAPAAPAAATAATLGAATITTTLPLTDQAVLDYLNKKGLVSAAAELSSLLKEAKPNDNDEAKKSAAALKAELDEDEAKSRSLLTKSTGGSYGYDLDAAWPVLQWGLPEATLSMAGSQANHVMGAEEAKSLMDSFIHVQLWVLGLPDHDGDQQQYVNPLERAHAVLQGRGSLQDVLGELTKSTNTKKAESKKTAAVTSSNTSTLAAGETNTYRLNMPPSCKPELLAVTFALLVHTYCELLEVGMEAAAHAVRDAFAPLYQPLYVQEFADLHQCATTDDMMKLNSHNVQHMEALANLKSILVAIAQLQLRREELQMNNGTLSNEAKKKLAEYDHNISVLQTKYKELSQRATVAFEKLYNVPFLRRARAVRWQLTLSQTTYALLCAFFNTSREPSLLVMSTLLQTKCELHVERRDPLPFTPACCILDDARTVDLLTRSHQPTKSTVPSLQINDMEIDWAAPLRRPATNTRLPFPKYHLEDEYETEEDAAKDKVKVEFNRALLVNGFRRLEALERKHLYDSVPSSKRSKLNDASLRPVANALEPTILLTTLCGDDSGPKVVPGGASSLDMASIWHEAGVGLCCAKTAPPDGRYLAVGCDDAAVRVWDLSRGGEPEKVLLGHKNGFPVFDLSWNRDSRCLLSAGGDGSVRLWDTMAMGPFGEEAPAPSKRPDSSKAAAGTAGAVKGNPSEGQASDNMDVPGFKPESTPYKSGAALAVYRGHAPMAPVWSVEFAPSGYFFASAAGDATARIWVSDRSVPVRLLVGHTASNVNCVSWHPNCNYVVTGSDDKTARLWDVHTGRTVRLLTDCSAGVNVVQISPGGKYAAGGDASGIVHLWDLASGKQVTEYRMRAPGTVDANQVMVHSLAFSPCGTALAAGGDDCCVRVWDVREAQLEAISPIVIEPTKSFASKQTVILDLQYSKRNLLLAAGKYVTPVPLATPIPAD